MNQENPTLFYGLNSFHEALGIATSVCNALGHGLHGKAVNLLLETAAAETQLGTLRDPTPDGAGMGLTQGDPIGVRDVALRVRYKDVKIIEACFGFDIRVLRHSDLAWCPVKAFVFTRIKYKLRPEVIPVTLKWRTRYWKYFYNSKLGKGTVRHFAESANHWLYDEHAPLHKQVAP